MIIKKLVGICPVCEELITLDTEDIKIESYNDEILITFKCPQCNEDIDQEAIEIE